MIKDVRISKFAKKQLERVPFHIVIKLQAWIEDVEARGLEEVRKIPGFHDEPLAGTRRGQRSIRLNRSYRAIYEMNRTGEIEFVSIEEVSKHEY